MGSLRGKKGERKVTTVTGRGGRSGGSGAPLSLPLPGGKRAGNHSRMVGKRVVVGAPGGVIPKIWVMKKTTEGGWGGGGDQNSFIAFRDPETEETRPASTGVGGPEIRWWGKLPTCDSRKSVKRGKPGRGRPILFQDFKRRQVSKK